MAQALNVVAVIAAYNEEDIIGEVVEALIHEGVSVYLVDNASTDATAATVEPFLGRGVLGIERFPKDAHADTSTFPWSALLRRKEELALELDADWFIHHDADEFRESPWPNVSLAHAIGLVDGAGYNAIDFELLNFWPTTPGGASRPIRESLLHYERGPAWDRAQVKCWKNTGQPIDLVSTGGHDVQFAGRRVFPAPFLLRHYPVRSDAHGRRKVFEERLPRFDLAERARGWHIQYEDLGTGAPFVRSAASLTPFNAEQVRADLWLRYIEEEHRRREMLATTVAEHVGLLQQRTTDLRALEQELNELRPIVTAQEAQLSELCAHLRRQDAELDLLRPTVSAQEAQLAELRAHLASQDDELSRLRPLVGPDTVDVERQRHDAPSQADRTATRAASIPDGSFFSRVKSALRAMGRLAGR
jgi:hypothetical protein